MNNIKQYENFMRNILEIPKEPYQSSEPATMILVCPTFYSLP